MKIKESKGFTLVELLVVIAIIGALSVFAIPTLFKNIAKAKVSAIKSDISAMQVSIDTFYTEYNRMPENQDEVYDMLNENVNSGFDRDEDSYKFKSGYEYRIDFGRIGNATEGPVEDLRVGGFQVNQSILDVLSSNPDAKIDINQELGNAMDLGECKDEFFHKYPMIISKNGTVWIYINKYR